MQDDYVAQIASMLVALNQRRSFMACDPSKRLGACHDAALDDRDSLEIYDGDDEYIFNRINEVLPRRGCDDVSSPNQHRITYCYLACVFFFFFSMHSDSACAHTGCIRMERTRGGWFLDQLILLQWQEILILKVDSSPIAIPAFPSNPAG
jgi:hypothetical protein